MRPRRRHSRHRPRLRRRAEARAPPVRRQGGATRSRRAAPLAPCRSEAANTAMPANAKQGARPARRGPQPRPAAIAAPPSQAPSAFAMLKAEWFKCRGQGLGVAGHVHQPDLQRRPDRDDRAHQKHVDRDRDGVRCAEHDRAEHDRIQTSTPAMVRISERSARRAPTRLPTTMPRPEKAEHQRHRAERHAADLGQDRLDVAEHREHPAEADRADAQGSARPAGQRQRAELAPGAGARGAARFGNAAVHQRAGERGGSHRPARRRARQPRCWPSQAAIGTADQGRAGQSEHHQPDRTGAPLAAARAARRPARRRRSRCRAAARRRSAAGSAPGSPAPSRSPGCRSRTAPSARSAGCGAASARPAPPAPARRSRRRAHTR